MPSTFGAAAAALEYSASDVTMIDVMAVCGWMPWTRGASASSVMTVRTPESVAMMSASRGV